jgi:hypothetical protein
MARSPGRRGRTPGTSDAVRATMRTVVEEFEQDLTALSTTLTRRQGLDSVSVKHVLDAACFLRTRPSGLKTRLVGAGGGMLLGAATSNAMALFNAPRPSRGGLAMTFASGVVGAVAIAVGAARDR